MQGNLGEALQELSLSAEQCEDPRERLSLLLKHEALWAIKDRGEWVP
jgi:hypothetical protein